MTTTTAEAARARGRASEEEPDDVIVLPDAAEQVKRPSSPSPSSPVPSSPVSGSPVETLIREFAGIIEPQVVERATAAARHALERSRIPATPDAIERLARDQLRARLTPSGRIRHRHG